MRSKIVFFIVLIILLICGIWLLIKNSNSATPNNNIKDVSIQTISDGTIQFEYPEKFGLATNREQILVSSYIPPCSENFDYCFYYNGEEFKNSNFESAGIKIYKRNDLITINACINTPPSGFATTKTPDGITENTKYSTSIFSNIGDAGAGHYANGELYRIFTNNKCYEIETRIGESQFANYPTGTIREFTETDRNKVYNYFNSLLNNLILISTKERIDLPDSEN